MTDFGLSKFLKKGELTRSRVGTPVYICPEIILEKGHSFPSDYWSLGILIYEMIFGVYPYDSEDES